VPARADGAARPKNRRRGRRFHHVASEDLRGAALELVRRARGPFASQVELLRAIRRRVRADDPLAVVGGRRLRYLLLATPGVRVDVEFTERNVAGALTKCPVCGGDVVPIRNRTLDAAAVTLGFRCPTCGYWTHRRRRVPVRYTFRAASDGTEPRATAPRRSA
jgi:tRNA(Ile2) C34 agmatinyltransferase TiaS